MAWRGPASIRATTGRTGSTAARGLVSLSRSWSLIEDSSRHILSSPEESPPSGVLPTGRCLLEASGARSAKREYRAYHVLALWVRSERCVSRVREDFSQWTCVARGGVGARAGKSVSVIFKERAPRGAGVVSRACLCSSSRARSCACVRACTCAQLRTCARERTRAAARARHPWSMVVSMHRVPFRFPRSACQPVGSGTHIFPSTDGRKREGRRR